ncbi:Methylmalonyl-CoA carboxyltransferase 12S subunit [Lacunisphaera limnophila]|uniref:Methylmalonyl-CoA carboxyltransferase 12S subunit n=1 Tax=Lacunisphaera limnophila TaxID=1838286 RepID=A0A1D8AVE1_9BACT|nr:acyl-CoA carboxylase subunit beta [Lacunisphaera limnophila]AOS44867.1 Methylmalonyl-CoA carboxyltransferase 12S subunit [Lacunisphaera limnophila]
MAIEARFLKELETRRKTARAAGGEDKLEARRAKGLMNARERVEALFQPGTFMEWGLHADHDCHDFGMEGKPMPGDGVITGVGYVDGRPVAVFSQDFTVGGGALGRIHSKKICDLMDYAMRAGIPVVGINDSGGARIQEGDDSLSGYGQVFYRNVLASGVMPQISIIAGPCAGGAAYSPALTDFIIMTRKNANMFICGPEVIKAATGQTVTMDEIGSASVNASVSGNVHFTAEDDAEALALARRLLAFLPANNVMDPPHAPTPSLNMAPDPVMNELVPSDAKMPLDINKIISRLVDNGDFLEVHREWAKNLVVGFGRVQGIVCGIVANQPIVKAGTLDIDSSDKGARFIRFCNAFNIPIVTLVDIPGFMPGVAQERGGIIRHGAKMLFAYAAASVPKITFILRKAYGGAYLAMCSSDMGADLVYAWPTAEIAVMGAEGAVKILYKREIAAAKDPKAKEAELAAEYRDKFASPYQAARKGLITDVIEPAQTRGTLAMALRNTLSKRETRPPKKHGNMPL